MDGVGRHPPTSGADAAAYLHGSDEIYLLEEPENGIHPLAVDCVFQSLRSVYGSQVLIATHSPGRAADGSS